MRCVVSIITIITSMTTKIGQISDLEIKSACIEMAKYQFMNGQARNLKTF